MQEQQQSPMKLRSDHSNSSERMRLAAPNNLQKRREGSPAVYRFNPEYKRIVTYTGTDDVAAKNIDNYMAFREK